MDKIRAFVVAGLAVAACSLQADPFEPGETGAAGAVTGPLSFTIETETGEQEVRLAALDSPVPETSRAALETLIAGQTVRLAYAGARRDRYDRALAQAWLEGDQAPLWIQQHLLETGAARVLSHSDNRAGLTSLLAIEAAAREAGQGLWADPAHRVRDTHPDALAQDIGSVQLVEGRVTDATRLRNGRTYLNFGADYRTDFTIAIDPAHAALFDEAGLSPERLEGRLVRVRGWLEAENGPMIRIDHPERIELLDDGAGETPP